MKKVGNVCLGQAGLAGKQRTTEDSLVDPAPRLDPQALV
jgi:hypothetical protein